MHKKKGFLMLYIFLFTIFLIFEQCSEKVNLLSSVTPKSLKLVTTFTLISTILSFTIMRKEVWEKN